jgi:hypothetical protein
LKLQALQNLDGRNQGVGYPIRAQWCQVHSWDLPDLVDHEKDVLLAESNADTQELADQPTYSGITNQDMINFFYAASSEIQSWQWIVDAQHEHMADPEQNRTKPYTGPKVENLPNLSADRKDKILAEM